MTSSNCPHERGHFVLVPHSHGWHVCEECPACGANVRGPGHWVGNLELVAAGLEIGRLPVQQKRPGVSSQPTLFGD